MLSANVVKYAGMRTIRVSSLRSFSTHAANLERSGSDSPEPSGRQTIGVPHSSQHPVIRTACCDGRHLQLGQLRSTLPSAMRPGLRTAQNSHGAVTSAAMTGPIMTFHHFPGSSSGKKCCPIQVLPRTARRKPPSAGKNCHVLSRRATDAIASSYSSSEIGWSVRCSTIWRTRGNRPGFRNHNGRPDVADQDIP